MKFISFFIKQLKYQIKNYFNISDKTNHFEFLDFLGFTALLTVAPFVGFIIFFAVSTILMLLFKYNSFPPIISYTMTGILFLLIFWPAILMILLSGSYLSYFIRCLNSSQDNNKFLLQALIILIIILVNFFLYYYLASLSIHL